MKKKLENSLHYSSRAFVNQLVETTERLKIVAQNAWKEAGLNREPVAVRIDCQDGTYEYLLNYYAVNLIKSKLKNIWTIPSAEQWKVIQTQEISALKNELIGSLSPLGIRENINFSNGYWTDDLQGERHAFVAMLTDLNDKIYLKSFQHTEGYLLRLIKRK